MRQRHLSRGLIALIAGYVVALQMLLLPLSLPSPALAIPAAGLCITAPDGPAHAPAGQDHGCPCAAGCGMQCHAPGLLPGAAESHPQPPLAAAAVLKPPQASQPAIPARHGARYPRGPPAA